MGSFWGGVGQGPGVWVFCVCLATQLRALPTPQQRSPSPLPRSLIGGEIFIVEVSFVVGGFGGGARGKGQGARGEGREGARTCLVYFSVACFPTHRLAAATPLHPRQSALLGPIRIEKLSLCRILPEGLRSSIGLLSRLWRWVFGRVWRAFPPPPPHFL